MIALEKLTVLILDDDASIRQLLTGEIMDRLRCNVISCATPEAAASLALAHQPHVILLDQSFGRGHPTGTEILPELRTAAPEAIIVSHTGEDPISGTDLSLAKGDATLRDTVDRIREAALLWPRTSG